MLFHGNPSCCNQARLVRLGGSHAAPIHFAGRMPIPGT
jgi:hypothetical protein